MRLSTSHFTRQAKSTKGKDAKKIGIGAGVGAAIGAIAGGGKGAAIGAGVGGGAGTGAVLATHGDPAVIGAESRLSFTLREPVTITEQPRTLISSGAVSPRFDLLLVVVHGRASGGRFLAYGYATARRTSVRSVRIEEKDRGRNSFSIFRFQVSDPDGTQYTARAVATEIPGGNMAGVD